MTNNTLFCGIALLVIGVYSYFVTTPDWTGKVNGFIEAHNVKATAADPNAPAKETKKVSPTSLIPAGLGMLLLAVVGVVIYKPDLRKHAMHFAALVGAAALGGGLYALYGGFKEWGELSSWTDPTIQEFWATLPKKGDGKTPTVSAWDQPKINAGTLTALVGAIYVGMAVKSFIDARKARESGTPPAATV